MQKLTKQQQRALIRRKKSEILEITKKMQEAAEKLEGLDDLHVNQLEPMFEEFSDLYFKAATRWQALAVYSHAVIQPPGRGAN